MNIQINPAMLAQVFIFVLLLAGGNICWKIGIDKMGGFMTGSGGVADNVLKLIQTPLIWAGGFLYIAGTLLWFHLLSKEHISYIYPLVSLSYLVMMLAGLFFFNETIPPHRWIGLGILMTGIVIISIK